MAMVMAMAQANQLAFGLALLALLLAAGWLLSRARRGTGKRSISADVLDDGAAPALRNQALIDAPSAVEAAAVSPAEMGSSAVETGSSPVEAGSSAAEPAPRTATALIAAADGDDLSRIKGLGPKLQALLPSLGLSTYAAIAALSEADLAALDPKLGAFAGRPARDKWVDQAKYLAAGDVAGFEAAFGKV